MHVPILSLALLREHDVVLARRRAREIAELLGFGTQEQTRIATAVSEIARNCYQYGRGGQIEFALAGSDGPQAFAICIRDEGPGIAALPDILAGHYISSTGMGLGIPGAQRLMDRFEVESAAGRGTTVRLEKQLPPGADRLATGDLAILAGKLAQPRSDFEEMQQQNQDLLRVQDELRRRDEELGRINVELDAQAFRLRRADDLKTRYLSNMSHEFRTPVNAILGLTRLLLDRGDLTPLQDQEVNFVRQSAHGLSDLVNDLLDIAKIEAGKVTVQFAPVDLAELFVCLNGMLQPLRGADVALVFESPAGVPLLVTDQGKLAQILRNLVTNALAFTARGEVRVTAGLDAAGDAVRFAVCDTGVGIAPAEQEHVFQEFAQVEGDHQATRKGTGLGLPLSRKLSEVLGGSLTLHSEPGAGCQFVLSLPLNQPGAQLEPTQPALPRPADHTTLERVLIIDDEAAARYVLKEWLAGLGCEIGEASHGTEGLRRAREEGPQAIFLDMSMGDMSGFEVLALLAADPRTRDIPVFIHTSNDLDDAERRRLVPPALAIVSKQDLARGDAPALLLALLASAGLYPRAIRDHASV